MLFTDFSSKLQEKLIWIKGDQLEGFYDPRGSYCQFDSDNGKPWTSELMLEAQNCPWLIFHDESDEARELEETYYEEIEPDDEDEEPYEEEVVDFCSGVAFISIKPEFLDLIIEE